jgi:hypothetical protein
MQNKLVFWIGILGILLFIVASTLGGFQFDDYNPISQLISETYAIDTPYGKVLRFFGYIPSGILLSIFSFSAITKFKKSNLTKIGFFGFGIFYGIATIIVGLFPCDKGCNKEFVDPSISQIIHTFTGFLTYLFVPISLLIIGFGLQQSKSYKKLSKLTFVCVVICIIFIGLLTSEPLANYIGFFQRIIEGTFIIWIISIALFIKNDSQFAYNTKGQ